MNTDFVAPPLLLDRAGEPASAALSRWVHAQVVYRGAVTLRGEQSVFPRLRELRMLERRSLDELHARQSERLADILTHAAAHSPFYRARWGSSAKVAAGDARARLAELQPVTKREVQEEFRTMVAGPRIGPITRKTTGGSTGQAVTVIKDRRATAAEMAASWLGYGWFGVRPGDRAARFWGHPSSVRRRLRFWAADAAMHRIRFSAFAFSAEDLECYWQRCCSFRPAYFYGYVSMLEAFARHVERQGHDGRQLGLRAIITTSEVLSEPQRKLLARVFGAPVQNEYGCGEVGPIAYECEAGQLHVMTENVVVELLDPSGRPVTPGDPGEIVVTDLNNRAMPLVRYRLADFGIAASTPCSCGRGFPVIDGIWGRAYDFVQDVAGRRYHGEFFMYVFEELRDRGLGVDQFQVEQTAVDEVVIRVVSAEPEVQQRLDVIETLVGRRLTGMQVRVQRVASIARSRSGKLRLIVNDLAPHRTSHENEGDVHVRD